MISAERHMERAIIKKIVEDALDSGCKIVHNDGEDNTVIVQVDESRTKQQAASAILENVQATDEEYLIFFKEGRRIGSVFLVYGNDGHDVIADHTDSEEMNQILSGASQLAESFAP